MFSFLGAEHFPTPLSSAGAASAEHFSDWHHWLPCVCDSFAPGASQLYLEAAASLPRTVWQASVENTLFSNTMCHLTYDVIPNQAFVSQRFLTVYYFYYYYQKKNKNEKALRETKSLEENSFIPSGRFYT